MQPKREQRANERKENKRKKPFIFFSRIRCFQRVTSEKIKKSRSSGQLALRVVRERRFSGAPRVARRAPRLGAPRCVTRFVFPIIGRCYHKIQISQRTCHGWNGDFCSPYPPPRKRRAAARSSGVSISNVTPVSGASTSTSSLAPSAPISLRAPSSPSRRHRRLEEASAQENGIAAPTLPPGDRGERALAGKEGVNEGVDEPGLDPRHVAQEHERGRHVGWRRGQTRLERGSKSAREARVEGELERLGPRVRPRPSPARSR